eukprot:IDg1825t1
MEAFVMIPFFLSNGALRQFESARRSGRTALFGLNDWPSTVNWLLRTYATNLVINNPVGRFRQIKQSEGEDDLSYFNRFEESHARCGEYLPPDQLISAYIESVESRVRLYLREAREDKRRITLFELYRKAANQGEALQRRLKTLRDKPTRPQGINQKDVNTIDGDRTQQVNIVQGEVLLRSPME